MSFSDVPPGPADPMFYLKQASDGDTSPTKIDAGIGVYRSEKPGYHEFSAITKAKKILYTQNAGHEYNPTTGIASFVSGATQLIFGRGSSFISGAQIASIQTVGGTGAVRIGAAFLNRNFPSYSPIARLPNPTRVFVGTPAWPNYVPLFQHAGFAVETFNHYDQATSTINTEAALNAIFKAPSHSIFIFQVCCHNPTGQDYSRDQWIELADAIQKQCHFVFFDIAYQGLASDMETDAWPIRYFGERKIDLLVCQSFSKHMGLYSERIGVLHVLCESAEIATNVKDQLRSLIRWEVSSTPAYGAQLADIIMKDPSLTSLWLSEVQEACDRMRNVRDKLHHALKNEYNTPGKWDHILQEKGLFSYMRLSNSQVKRLRSEHHVYVADSGRVNVAGLNLDNLQRFAEAIDAVVRDGSKAEANLPAVRESRL